MKRSEIFGLAMELAYTKEIELLIEQIYPEIKEFYPIAYQMLKQAQDHRIDLEKQKEKLFKHFHILDVDKKSFSSIVGL